MSPHYASDTRAYRFCSGDIVQLGDLKRHRPCDASAEWNRWHRDGYYDGERRRAQCNYEDHRQYKAWKSLECVDQPLHQQVHLTSEISAENAEDQSADPRQRRGGKPYNQRYTGADHDTAQNVSAKFVSSENKLREGLSIPHAYDLSVGIKGGDHRASGSDYAHDYDNQGTQRPYWPLPCKKTHLPCLATGDQGADSMCGRGID